MIASTFSASDSARLSRCAPVRAEEVYFPLPRELRSVASRDGAPQPSP